MHILFWSLIISFLSFLIHLVVWRIRLPERQTKRLLQIFFVVLVASLFLLWKYQDDLSVTGIPLPQGILEYLHISLFFTAGTLAYMITYSALEADSPSLVMVRAIEKAREEGLPQDAFDDAMNDDVLVKPRIRDLITDEMAYIEGDRYKLTEKGKLMAKIFVIYRGILGASRGG